MKITITILFTILFFTGCAQKYTNINTLSKANLKELSFDEIKGFEDNDFKASYDTFKLACTKSKRFEYLKIACEDIDKYQDPKEFFTTNFVPYQLYDDKGNDEGLITGYYEPILNGSLIKTDIYQYPLYKVPKDLVIIDLSPIYPELKKYKLRGKLVGNKVIPYDSRKEIDKDDSDLEPLVYLDSKIDRFFLEVQGSGKVRLDSGEIINVGYENQNGHKYYSIGKKLIEIGAIKKEDVSLQTIKKWFEENPNRIDEILSLNKSVIFFAKREESATGALGVPLVEQRNIAVDTRYIPLGLPVFLNTTNPLTNKEINNLVVAADVGGAIKGDIRADLFFGNSNLAENLAGNMKQKGELILFIPKKLAK